METTIATECLNPPLLISDLSIDYSFTPINFFQTSYHSLTTAPYSFVNELGLFFFCDVVQYNECTIYQKKMEIEKELEKYPTKGRLPAGGPERTKTDQTAQVESTLYQEDYKECPPSHLVYCGSGMLIVPGECN